MTLYTDDHGYARTLLPAGSIGPLAPRDPSDASEMPESPLLRHLLQGGRPIHHAPLHQPGWQYLIATGFARGSQYDRLIGLARRAPLPDRVACVARTGIGFHGFRNRSWAARPGNIHLTAHFAPERPIERFDTAFTAMAAVAVVEAIDEIPGLAGRARIKWVNDVLIDGAKVAGVLSYTQARGAVVSSVVLGIGVNVETTPEIVRSPQVPSAGSLTDAAPDAGAAATASVLASLLRRLTVLYDAVRDEGPRPIIDLYRSRSAIIGHEVVISGDDGDGATSPVLAAGRVAAIGDGLELYLDGRTEPITRGRVILGAAVP